VPRFAYLAPTTLDEALDVLRQHRDEAKVLAGGQSLLPLLNYRLARPRVVVDVNDLPLDGIRPENGRLRLGALTRHADLIESSDVARECPILAEAAALVGNVRVRTLGTLGGSLAHADPAAELPMVMLALDAGFAIASSSGTRRCTAADFFTGALTTALGPNELLTDVEVPSTRGRGWAVEELSRRPGDFAIVAVAALVALDGEGRVEDARIAFGGVAPVPVRARAAEEDLRGVEPTAERVTQAAELARNALQPGSDAFVSGAYRKLVAGVVARRALTRAVLRARAA
jgi:CO/xanthine dehydrogenase FAD-binding subunit